MCKISNLISEQYIKKYEVCGTTFNVVPYIQDTYYQADVCGNKHLCIQLLNVDSVNNGDLDYVFNSITENIPHYSLDKNCVFLNNFSSNLGKWLSKNGFGRSVDYVYGHEIFKFKPSILRQLNNELYKEYAAQYK